jgi:hypothetical protein
MLGQIRQGGIDFFHDERRALLLCRSSTFLKKLASERALPFDFVDQAQVHIDASTNYAALVKPLKSVRLLK